MLSNLDYHYYMSYCNRRFSYNYNSNDETLKLKTNVITNYELLRFMASSCTAKF